MANCACFGVMLALRAGALSSHPSWKNEITCPSSTCKQKYYEKLYKKKNTSNSKYNFFNNNMSRLNEIESSKCNGLLTEYECGLTIKQM